MSLSELCFDQIKNDYWFAQYGCSVVIMNKSNSWINVSKLCSNAGKKFEDWKCDNNELILAVEAHNGALCMKTVDAGIATVEDWMISGTYAHPLLIPHVASWTNPSYARMLSKVVNNNINKEFKQAHGQ